MKAGKFQMMKGVAPHVEEYEILSRLRQAYSSGERTPVRHRS